MPFYAHLDRWDALPIVQYQPGAPLERADERAFRLDAAAGDPQAESLKADRSAALFRARLTAFLAEPEAPRAAGLVLGPWAPELDEGLPEHVALLTARADRLAGLRALFLGDAIDDESDVSVIHLCDLTPLLARLPRLRALGVRGGPGLELPDLRHDELRKLVVESAGLPSHVIEQIAAADLPRLEHLELWLGSRGRGFDGSVETLRPLLEAGRFPRLRALGLRNAELAEDVALALKDAPVLAQLEWLSLGKGALGDRGAAALIANASLSRLKRLDLSHHYINAAPLLEAFRALGPEVDLSDARHVQLCEGRRYCPVWVTD